MNTWRTIDGNEKAARVLADNSTDGPNGCREWARTVNAKGYGRLRWVLPDGRRVYLAHRAAYETHVGRIPDGMEIDHKCKNRACINPAHLEVVDHGTNVRRSEPATKQFCVRGHPLSGENLVRGAAGRVCRTCLNNRARERYVPKSGQRRPWSEGFRATR